MNLLQMSFSGAILILAIMIIRVAAINKLPKKTFLILWGIVLLRLLLPFSIPSILSIYSLVNQNTSVHDTIAGTPAANLIPIAPAEQISINGALPQSQTIQWEHYAPILLIIWSIGTVLCAAFFVISYLRCYLEFQTSLPVSNDFATQWLKEHQPKRPVTIRQSGRITAPLTYGIFHPVILMPKNTDWENRQQLQYVLCHEYTHICHFDLVLKLIAALALCIHWFNPLVWVMYILFNRDIELACDESVIRQFGENSRSVYARALISMEEAKSSIIPFCNNFSKNAIEERITAIMKTKKLTLGTIAISIVILAVTATLFATSAQKSDPVLTAAKELVSQKYTNCQDANYSNWRIESLTHVYTYEEFEGMTLQIYQLNYEFFADNPENVMLVGGMTIDEDGWVVPEYANSTFLIFKQEGASLSYLAYIFENDCSPGDEIFTSDLKQIISSFSPEQATAQLAASVSYSDSKVSFTIPEGNASWNIWISGRVQVEGFGGMSVHYLTDESENNSWEAGKTYSFDVSDGTYTELFLDANMDGEEISIDLMTLLPDNLKNPSGN